FAATMERLTKHLKSGAASPADPTLAVATARGTRIVPLSEIEWIEAADNYSKIWVDGRSHLIRRPLHELEQLVVQHGFVRAHRSALLPIKRIHAVQTTVEKGTVAILAGGEEIPISRRRRAAFTKLIRSRG